MSSPVSNLLDSMPARIERELVDDLLRHEHIRIERIISAGQVTPEQQWYDQDENEWVLVLQGEGRLLFEDGTEISLGVGDYVNIPAHQKHRVSWTAPDELTIWLAVFYR